MIIGQLKSISQCGRFKLPCFTSNYIFVNIDPYENTCTCLLRKTPFYLHSSQTSCRTVVEEEWPVTTGKAVAKKVKSLSQNFTMSSLSITLC